MSQCRVACRKRVVYEKSYVVPWPYIRKYLLNWLWRICLQLSMQPIDHRWYLNQDFNNNGLSGRLSGRRVGALADRSDGRTARRSATTRLPPPPRPRRMMSTPRTAGNSNTIVTHYSRPIMTISNLLHGFYLINFYSSG